MITSGRAERARRARWSRPIGAWLVVAALVVAASAATPAPATAAGTDGHRWPDVTPDHPFFHEIEWLYAADVADGNADNSFTPGALITRQAIASWLQRYFTDTVPEGGFPDPGFSDVPADHPFRYGVAFMKWFGLSTGHPDGTFRPGEALTRQAYITFLWRASFQPQGPFPDPGFTDVGADHPFRTAIHWGASVGLVQGYPDGTFRGGELITRQAAAAWMSRLGLRTRGRAVCDPANDRIVVTRPLQLPAAGPMAIYHRAEAYGDEQAWVGPDQTGAGAMGATIPWSQTTFQLNLTTDGSYQVHESRFHYVGETWFGAYFGVVPMFDMSGQASKYCSRS